MVYHQYRYLIGSYSSNQIGFADRVEYSARILQAYLYHVQHAKFLTSSVNNAIVYRYSIQDTFQSDTVVVLLLVIQELTLAFFLFRSSALRMDPYGSCIYELSLIHLAVCQSVNIYALFLHSSLLLQRLLSDYVF